MPGPAPKPASTRARQNRTSTAATLRATPGAVVPALPDRGSPWHPQTLAWWVDVWRSPMAPEYDDSDRHGLFQLAMLVDAFWLADSPRDLKEMAAEIRQQSQRFGLSPLDRRRLQWEIDRGDEAAERTRKRQPAAETRPKTRKDPRAGLHAV